MREERRGGGREEGEGLEGRGKREIGWKKSGERKDVNQYRGQRERKRGRGKRERGRDGEEKEREGECEKE